MTDTAGEENPPGAGPVTRWCCVHGRYGCQVLGSDGKTYPAHPLPVGPRARLAAEYVAEGRSHAETAAQLGVSERTVRADLDRIDERGNATCADCVQMFTPARSDAAYCSPACRQRAYRRRRDAS